MRRSAKISILPSTLVGVSTLLLAAGSHAETEVATARTEPVVTSNANGGTADDVAITAAGSITLDGGTAVTLDSDNSVSNAGTITIEDADGAVGVAVLGGRAGAVTNSGSIVIDETNEITDDDEDGDYDGPFATGSGRYGVRVTGAAPFTGVITNSGTISIEGADSAGISVETDLVGSILQSGVISVSGDRTAGVRVTGAVSGDVTVTGAVNATGENAKAVDLSGDIGGRLVIQSGVTSTGYRYTSRSSDQDALDALDADDLLQGGPALTVAGNVAGGILLDVPPTDADEDVDDEDGDGVDDSAEGSAAVASYGAEPGMVIGAVGRDVIIGDVGTGDDAYGLLVRGSVTSSGVYDGVSAEALRIGVAGGGTTSLGGGVRISGSVGAAAYEADAVALRLNAGALVPAIRVDGVVSASISAEGRYTASAVVIEPGATAGSLTVSGGVSASVSGEAGDAVAVLDRSGTLTNVDNTGSISAFVTATDDSDDTDDDDTDAANETVTGRAIALDLRANTAGVNLVQYGIEDGDDGDDEVADADEDGDGVDDLDEPAIVGDILLGSGADSIRILNGTVTGAIAFGGGANSLDIDGGAIVKGAITAEAGTLALTIGTGKLTVTNAGSIDMTRLNLGAGSTLVLTVDPETGAYTSLDVAGAATVADGAKIGVRLTSLLQGEASYALIQAGSLTSAAPDSTFLGDVPYLYDAALATDSGVGTISLTLARKSEANLSLPASISAAYDPIIGAIGLDADFRDAVLAQTTRQGFVGVYNQMLPDHQGAVAELVVAGGQAVSRAVEDRQGPDAGGFWVQETGFLVQRDDRTEDPGYNAWSLGLAAGWETGAASLGVVGATLAGSSGRVEGNQDVSGDTMIVNSAELGAYWRVVEGGLALNARAGASWVGVTNTRAMAVYDEDETRTLFASTKGKWSGAAFNGRLSAAYEARFGRFYLRPAASLDYFWLREDAYTEDGGGAAFDLDVGERTSKRLDGFVGVTGGARYGEDNWWGPEMQIGWRTVNGDAVETSARFASGVDHFTLLADEVTGSGPVIRGAVKGEDVSAAFALEGGAAMRDDIAVYDLRLAAHFRF